MKSKGKFLIISAAAAIGFGAGYLGLKLTEGSFPLLLLCVLCLFLSFPLHIIVHEGGHLLMGLLTGYHFVSFRVGRTVWVRRRSGIVRKKYTLRGTGGQCLLDPPDPDENGRYPYLLYNLGGGLANFLSAGAALSAVFSIGTPAARAVLAPFALVGFYLGLVNLIPMTSGDVANDGGNIKIFGRNPESVSAFFQGLRINRLQNTEGMRLKEMPEKYFAIPESGSENNPLVDMVRVFRFERLEDEGRFEEARLYGEELMKREMLEEHKTLVQAELLFLELIGPQRCERIEELFSGNLARNHKSSKNNPYIHRTMYAYARIYEGDAKMAAEKKRYFERSIKNHQSAGEVRTEEYLMEVIEQC